MTATYDLKRGFTITRLLDAPRDVVFQAWTDASCLHWFFNPKQVPATPIHVDLRVGGEWRQEMVLDDRTRYVTGGVYREIVPNERLVFTWGARGGWPALDPDRLDDAPLVTVTLRTVGEKTEMVLTLRLADHLSDEKVREWMSSGMREGWTQTLARLLAQTAPPAAPGPRPTSGLRRSAS